MSIDRSEAIKRTVLIMGGLVFAPNIIGVLKGCSARPCEGWSPKFFNKSQARLVTMLTDIILPATDTPGASDVGVPEFIEEMVETVYDEDAREQFISGMEAFNKLARDEYENDFVDLNFNLQLKFVNDQNRLAVSGQQMYEPGIAFFQVLKELTILGFFTSEPGATQVLKYEMVPGRYKGCVPFEKVGKTWVN